MWWGRQQLQVGLNICVHTFNQIHPGLFMQLAAEIMDELIAPVSAGSMSLTDNFPATDAAAVSHDVWTTLHDSLQVWSFPAALLGRACRSVNGDADSWTEATRSCDPGKDKHG